MKIKTSVEIRRGRDERGRAYFLLVVSKVDGVGQATVINHTLTVSEIKGLLRMAADALGGGLE